MRKRIKSIFTRITLAVAAVSFLAAVIPVALGATSRIYYNIDFSQEVLASRVDQRVSGGCAVAAMATVESYMFGAKTEDEIEAVYDALIDINGKDNYAYWSRCGFSSSESISWTKVYNQLAAGYPCLIHRKATSSASEHWSVVAGYFGSTTKLEKDKFLVVEVNDNFKTEIYTSAEWGKGTTIDKMVIRKAGIPYTNVDGITFAINHPAVVHQYDKAQNVYGQITSNENLTDIRIQVTDVNADGDIYDKTVYPDAKNYNINALDNEMAYSAWPVGQYFLTVTARTQSETKVFQYYFEIREDWPETMPTRNFSLTYDEQYGEPTVSETAYLNTLQAPAPVHTRADRAFVGWNVRRDGDGKWLSIDGTWCTEEEILADPSLLMHIQPGQTLTLDHTWIQDCIANNGYTFHGVWDQLFLFGDANRDEKTDYMDAYLLMRYTVGLIGAESLDLNAVDVNGDGKQDYMDAYLIMRRSVGLIEEFPVEAPATAE